MDDPAKNLAIKLREIAEQVKAWERRDMEESGELSRPAYFVDLDNIAQMFDGNHPRYRLRLEAKGGWQRTAENVVRDFAIAEFMDERRSRDDYNYDADILEAAERFGVSKPVAAAADTRYSKVMQSGADRDTAIAMELLVATRRAVKAT